jgi:hypothetical protein
MELNRKVLPLKDYKSLRALNALQALLIGMKMLPAYAHLSLEEFVALVEAMSPEDQVTILTNGAKIVELAPEEVKALVCFCTDKNGVPYTAENMKNLGPGELVEVIVTVCMEVIRNVHIDLVTQDEKKN